MKAADLKADYDYTHDVERGKHIPYQWCEDVIVGFKSAEHPMMHLGPCRAAIRYDYDKGFIEIFTPHTARTLLIDDVLYVEQIYSCELVQTRTPR